MPGVRGDRHRRPSPGRPGLAPRATEFLATGTAVRRLADEHKLPETSPKPTFTLGLDK